MAASVTTLAMEEIQTIYTSEMITGFQKMRKEGAMCDTVLVCGNAEFPVHRVVLCVGSPYFKSLLTQAENISSRIELPPPVEPAALEFILTFLYTGSVRDLQDHVRILPAVLKAAEFFQLSILYEFCWNVAMSNLCTDTFAEIWGLADACRDKKMIPCLTSFAISNLYKIIETAGFLKLPIHQFHSLLRQLPKRIQQPDVIVRGILNWINDNVPGRLGHLLELFSVVDLRSVSNQYLKSIIMNEDIIKMTPDVYNRLVAIAMDRLHTQPNNSFKNLRMITFTYDNDEPSEIRQYNLETHSWLPRQTFPVALAYGTVAAYLHDYVYFCGGGREPNEATEMVEIYNIAQNIIVFITKMVHRRFRPGVVTFQNQLYVVGGANETGSLREVERYDPETQSWNRVAPTVAAHSCPNVVSVANYLYVVGSWNCCNVERYDASVDSWTLIQGIPSPTNHVWPSVTTCHGKVYVIKSMHEKMFHVFDPLTDHWSVISFGMASNIAVRDQWHIVNDAENKPLIFVLSRENELFSFNCLEAKLEKCVDAPFDFAVKRVLTFFTIV